MLKPFNNKLHSFIAKFQDYFDLKSDTDKVNTVASIKSAIPMRGANLWYLICSALLASIGLDVNSPAIIIGAMLISPLMSPILGIGLSFGIHDKESILISVKEFTIAVVLSILTSTAYFLVSPLGSPTTEILARTNPTLLDVGVAFFGGVAGIVAGSRSKAANAIPGVAIATALMPPICSAGFGLASGNAKIFFGAIYLFFINAVFISLSVYFIVRFLRFPYKVYPNAATKKRMRFVVMALVLLITVPSIYIFYGIIIEARTNAKINIFINRNVASDKTNVLRWNSIRKGDSTTLKILLAGEQIDSLKLDSLSKKMSSFGLNDMKLSIIQVGLVDEHEGEETRNTIIELAELSKRLDENVKRTEQLEEKLNYYTNDSIIFSQSAAELKSNYPDIENIKFEKSVENNYTDSLKVRVIPSFTINWGRNISSKNRKIAIEKIYAYLKEKFKTDTVIIK
ncbi:MAG: DUF389 domain-containing protein [Ignavibacteria bacterium]|nr:DUF389 domain-containing protein [Ignavibacteria bacterium]